jgi:hypothetical protein
LLTGQAHIIRATAAELRSRRTLDGAKIDEVIEGAVAARGLEGLGCRIIAASSTKTNYDCDSGNLGRAPIKRRLRA